MSSIINPKTRIAPVTQVQEKELPQVQDRGKIGRTILGGLLKEDKAKTEKKTILGG